MENGIYLTRTDRVNLPRRPSKNMGIAIASKTLNAESLFLDFHDLCPLERVIISAQVGRKKKSSLIKVSNPYRLQISRYSKSSLRLLHHDSHSSFPTINFRVLDFI